MTDRVLPEVHAAVMRRDRQCVLALLDKAKSRVLSPDCATWLEKGGNV